MTAVLNLKPGIAIGGFEFGQKRGIVRRTVGAIYKPFKKSIFSKSLTDAYENYHAYYDKNDCLIAVEVFGGAMVVYDGVTVFPGAINSINNAFPIITDQSGCSYSASLKARFYAPEDQIESVTFATDEYFRQ